MRLAVAPIVGFALALATGCHSAKLEGSIATFSARGAHDPLSFTGALVDEKGIVAPGRIHPVAKFLYASKGCAKRVDLSEAFNKAIADARADAIVNLVIASRAEAGCVEVRISGEIVKVDE